MCGVPVYFIYFCDTKINAVSKLGYDFCFNFKLSKHCYKRGKNLKMGYQSHASKYGNSQY